MLCLDKPFDVFILVVRQFQVLCSGRKSTAVGEKAPPMGRRGVMEIGPGLDHSRERHSSVHALRFAYERHSERSERGNK